jgi:hypothetical protein
MNLDAHGIIVQRDGDGGDSLHHHASYAFLKKFREDKNVGPSLVEQELPLPKEWSEVEPEFTARQVIHGDLMKPMTGYYVRHPDPREWYSNPWTTSRDQLMPCIMALGAHRMYGKLWSLQWRILARFTLAQNIFRNWDSPSVQKPKLPDPFIGHLHVLIRAWNWYALPFYPLLLVLDLVMLIGEIIGLIPIHFKDGGKMMRKQPDDCDDNNGVNQHIQAIYSLPTPFSWLARQLYAKFRADNYGMIGVEDATRYPESGLINENNAVMGALMFYHRTESGGSPFLGHMYRPIVYKYFQFGNRL